MSRETQHIYSGCSIAFERITVNGVETWALILRDEESGETHLVPFDEEVRQALRASLSGGVQAVPADALGRLPKMEIPRKRGGRG
jgi:hypothetical protein